MKKCDPVMPGTAALSHPGREKYAHFRVNGFKAAEAAKRCRMSKNTAYRWEKRRYAGMLGLAVVPHFPKVHHCVVVPKLIGRIIVSLASRLTGSDCFVRKAIRALTSLSALPMSRCSA